MRETGKNVRIVECSLFFYLSSELALNWVDSLMM